MHAVECKNVLANLYTNGPRLLADIGGTNARFAIEWGPRQTDQVCVLACADFADLEAVMRAYLAQINLSHIDHAAIAIANPIDGDQVKMTNHHWCFSIEATRRALNLETLLVVNDFTALAMSLPYLDESEKLQIGEGEARQHSVIGLVGAGTGLGVSGLIPYQHTWMPLNSEGGHRSFAPNDALETQILQWMWQEFSHVSAERLASGPGIAYLYRALADIYDVSVGNLQPQQIVQRARSGDDLSLQTIQVFSQILGGVAGDLALTLGSFGGVYIGGGVVNQLDNLFDRESFRERFVNKGRFADFLAKIPTYLITAQYPAFLGISALLQNHLQMHRKQT